MTYGGNDMNTLQVQQKVYEDFNVSNIHIPTCIMYYFENT